MAAVAPESAIVVRPEPEQPAARPAPLLAAYVDPLGQGRDSLGRGTSAAEIGAAVARDAGVQRCERELDVWLRQAYRDPDEASRRLGELTAAGDGRAAAQALRHGGPEMLGELRGKAGWFTSKAARAERDAAERCARAVPSGLVRLQEVTERAGQGYVREVRAQRERDAVAVPGLSEEAWAAVRAVEQAREAAVARATAAQDNPVWVSLLARQGGTVAAAWAREVESKPAAAAELRAVVAAAGRRLGEDGAREAVWGAQGGAGVALSDGPGPREGVGGIGRVLAAVQDGQLAREAQERVVERQREAERERLGLRRGYGLRM